MAAIAAGRALWCISSGLFFQTMRSVSDPYFARSADSVASARSEKGHSKSPNSTIVTGANRLPQVGLRGEMGTAASSSLVTGAAAGVAEALPIAVAGLAGRCGGAVAAPPPQAAMRSALGRKDDRRSM